MNNPPSSRPLRNGFTTGSAAAAAAVGAWRSSSGTVLLELPSGERLPIPVHLISPGVAEAVKDGGDDPDVTNGSKIRAALRPFSGPADPADYLEKKESLELIFRGGEGIGRVTRPGLAVPVGKSAINPAPRRIILENLFHAGCRSGRWLLVLSVPDGDRLAKETLNPALGIEGGISILGHSGIVRPYSNAAYGASLVLQLKSLAARGIRTAALTTGNRSTDAVLRDFPFLTAETVLRIGDFIFPALTAARHFNFESLILGCMPGKLFKYACGEKNTHAHRCKLSPEKLSGFGVELPDIPLDRMDTMGELAAALTPERYAFVLDRVFKQAETVLCSWTASEINLTIALYDDAGRRIR